MPKYLDISTGKHLTENDSKRGIWYSAGNCGYWTDDWDKLGGVGSGIPACPVCDAVGMQTTAKDWFEGAMKHEQNDHPYYLKFLEAEKEVCNRDMTWEEKYKKFVEEQL